MRISVRGLDMLRLFMWWWFFFLLLAPYNGFAATTETEYVPTLIIPGDEIDDSFDKEFADDFDNDFIDPDSLDNILIPDPLEKLNRGVFWVNDKLYFYLMKPVTRGYRYVLPRPARVSVSNFFSNIATPVRAANALLQLKFTVLANEFYRFVVNTTIGIGGLFDPAASVAGVRKNEEDFGQTLGYYGARHGFYLVLPVIGPSSLRDGVGGLVDTLFDPLHYTNMNDLEYLGVKSYKVMNGLSLDRDTYEGIVRDSLDPYLFIRVAYAQRRAALVGKTEFDILMIDDVWLDPNNLNPFNYNLNPFEWLGD